MSGYEYEVQGLYSGEWEAVTTEDKRPEALARLAEYRANVAGTVFRVRRVAVKA